jgi:hypothetical protein
MVENDLGSLVGIRQANGHAMGMAMLALID